MGGATAERLSDVMATTYGSNGRVLGFIKARIADFYDSSSGHLEFAVVEQSAFEDVRGLVVQARRTYIHRLAR